MPSGPLPAAEGPEVRWWDAGARVRAALVGLSASGLAVVGTGWVRPAAAVLAALAVLLLLRSLRAPSTRPVAVESVPARRGGFLVGHGFEWTPAEAQETAESGRPAVRAETELVLPDRLLQQHTLVLGTTGVGKSRLLEFLALQAVARGDAVVVIDPKGDDGLLRRVRAASAGRFRLFSLPHPEASETYNPLGRYRHVREVADRVAALLPSTGEALPFRNFAWEIVHAAAAELDGRKAMTIRNLKRAAIDRPAGALASRPREHHLKMASALVPLFAKLSGEILSPERGGLTWDEADRERLVVYFSLGALLGQESASAVAKMAVMDLAAYAGSRYAYGKGHGPVWIFIDELGDVVTDGLVSLLNKGRAAGIRIVACAQTLGDLEASLGSAARAQQVVGNASVVVQFRAQSAEDALSFSRMAGDRRIRCISEAASYEPSLLSSGLRPVDDFRARFGESAEWRDQPLVAPWLVAQLPVGAFLCRFEGRVFRGRVPLLP